MQPKVISKLVRGDKAYAPGSAHSFQQLGAQVDVDTSNFRNPKKLTSIFVQTIQQLSHIEV